MKDKIIFLTVILSKFLSKKSKIKGSLLFCLSDFKPQICTIYLQITTNLTFPQTIFSFHFLSQTEASTIHHCHRVLTFSGAIEIKFYTLAIKLRIELTNSNLADAGNDENITFSISLKFCGQLKIWIRARSNESEYPLDTLIFHIRLIWRHKMKAIFMQKKAQLPVLVEFYRLLRGVTRVIPLSQHEQDAEPSGVRVNLFTSYTAISDMSFTPEE